MGGFALSGTGTRMVDLTRMLEPGKEVFKLELHTIAVDELLPGFHRPPGQWYIMQEWEVSSHIGTHVEVPYHYMEDGADVSQLPVDQLIGEACVLDLSGRRAGEEISQTAVRAAGAAIQEGDIVLLHTGYDRLYGSSPYDRPYLSTAAIQWLADQGIKALGIDASGLEKYKAQQQPAHLLLFERGIPIIEELTHLEQLSQQRVFFIALPLPIRGADACPVRAVAFESV